MSAPTADEYKELGNKAFAAKDFETAIAQYTKAIQKDPKNHVYYSNRSASYGGQKDWEAAATDAKDCIRLDPTFVKGYYRLAVAQIELKDWDGANNTIKQGLAVDANNDQLLKQLRTVKQAKRKSELESQQDSRPQQQRRATKLDAATSRELQDLQQQLAMTSREFNLAKANLIKAQREYKANDITKAELEKLPEESTCYRSIGKMFLKSTRSRVMEHLDKSIDEEKKKETETNQKLEYLERRMKSQQQNIDELHSTQVAAE